ncbi:hypothetical protein JNM87_06740 [Candidatus Saccharibacteria bacterium]|nr:hypothetical protein [Candidatus Saccharibacteria bacterium]
MDEHFELLHEHLKLTPNQRAEVRRKYDGVSRSLYSEFYDSDYNPRTRLIIGSHGKKTETRHPIGDIDLIFKISKADLERYQGYESNGPSALLQRARTKLQETYPNTTEIKSWGKVVLVGFGDGQHKVEVLPCYENDDGTFTVPNSENGGSWDNFDPRKEMNEIAESHAQTGITRQMIKMIKRWRRKNNATIKSYQIEFFCVSFLSTEYETNISWSQLMEEFFTWLELQSEDYDSEALSKVTSAKNRASKARGYELDDNFEDACVEWRKIFGRQFPLYDPDMATIRNLEAEYPVDDEEFIHHRFPVKIDRSISLKIVSRLKREGFRDYDGFKSFFRAGHRFIPFKSDLEFLVKCNLGKRANYYWKIRNFHDDAQEANDLRGEIIKDNNKLRHTEGSKYSGTHYVDCYAVVAGEVVAMARRFVPIGDEA